MNAQLNWGSGRRWFGAAVNVFIWLTLVASLQPAMPATAAFPGRNGKLLLDIYRNDNGDIYVIEPDGAGLTRLTTNAAPDYQGAWSPDGSRIAFTSIRDGNGEIYVMNADGSNQVRLTTKAAWDDASAWSPDGARIAFMSQRDGNNEIYVMNNDGSGQTNLTRNEHEDGGPAWSPDGTKIAFQSDRGGTDQDIYVMNADGSDVTQLTQEVGWDWNPGWAPDGTRIVFNRGHIFHDSLGQDIWVMNADGSEKTNLTPHTPGSLDSDAAWSPDGTRIAFWSTRSGNEDIWIMNADGTGAANVTNSDENDRSVDWQPLTIPDGVCPTGDPHVANAFTTLLGSGISSAAAPVTKALSLPNSANLTGLYAQYAGKDFGLLPTQVVFQTTRETITQTTPASAAYRHGAIYWYGTPLQVTVSTAKVSVWDQYNRADQRTPRAFLLYATHRKGAEYFDYVAQLADSRRNFVFWDAPWIAAQRFTIDIPTLTEARDITIQAAVVDNDRDGRAFQLTATAGNVTKTISRAAPNKGNMLDIVTIKLLAVPAGANEIVLDLVSPPGTGDSVALVGLAMHYACEE